MDKDISTEQKTWQVYNFGKRNVSNTYTHTHIYIYIHTHAPLAPILT